jgi:ADP-ribose pyrophosphatase
MKPETVFRTPWFQIATVAPGAEASGTPDPYYCLVRPPGVIACILDKDGRLVLIDQYRPPLGRSTLEMPAGTIDEGETPEEGIAREIFEETGFVCETLVPIAPCRLMLNRENVIEYFFVGLRARRTSDVHKKEQVTVRVLERDQLVKLVKKRHFEQTVALGGIYMTDKIYGIDLLKDKIDVIEAKLMAAL